MDTWIWIVIAAVVVIAVIFIVAAAMASRRRRTHLQERFGPEYDRTVESADRRRASAIRSVGRHSRRSSSTIRRSRSPRPTA